MRKQQQTDLSLPLRCSSVMVKMACEREEAAFMAVEPTVRTEFPISKQPTISWAENTCLSVKPTIWKNRIFSINTKADPLHYITFKKEYNSVCVSIYSKLQSKSLFFKNMPVTHLYSLFRVFPNAEAKFVFRRTQQVQYVFIIDLQSKRKRSK